MQTHAARLQPFAPLMVLILGLLDIQLTLHAKSEDATSFRELNPLAVPLLATGPLAAQALLTAKATAWALYVFARRVLSETQRVTSDRIALVIASIPIATAVLQLSRGVLP
ncbi:MAG: hypothetical protein ACYDDF_11520 [Thermoplasmatota archaeon]